MTPRRDPPQNFVEGQKLDDNYLSSLDGSTVNTISEIDFAPRPSPPSPPFDTAPACPSATRPRSACLASTVGGQDAQGDAGLPTARPRGRGHRCRRPGDGTRATISITIESRGPASEPHLDLSHRRRRPRTGLVRDHRYRVLHDGPAPAGSTELHDPGHRAVRGRDRRGLRVEVLVPEVRTAGAMVR